MSKPIKEKSKLLVKKAKVFFNQEFKTLKQLEKDDFDLANSGQWPLSLKVFSMLLLLAGLVYASHWLILSSYKEELDSALTKQDKLYEEYRLLTYQTANLNAYQQQLVIMQETLEDLLTFIPSSSSIPPLLDAIQQDADKLKLDLVSLTLKQEKPSKIYTEIPFTLAVKGGYHQIASYLTSISSLNRIVTLHNFTLKPEDNNPKQLRLFIDASTYRKGG